jgi:DNA-binding response OmpR family regulator
VPGLHQLQADPLGVVSTSTRSGPEELPCSPLVLVVDDDAASRGVAVDSLRGAGFRVEPAASASEGLAALFAHRHDAVVLDLRMPGIDGWSLLGRIREMTQELPIVVLSGLDTPGDRVRSFTLGGDDFIAKPFLPSELIARTRALLRRARLPAPAPAQPSPITTDWLDLDIAACRVVAHGQEVHLSPREFRLLVALARRSGAVCGHEELIAEVWGLVPGLDSRGALSVLVSRLRRRLGDDPSTGRTTIDTVRGFGYRLVSRLDDTRERV